jgi:hypothetical protein
MVEVAAAPRVGAAVVLTQPSGAAWLVESAAAETSITHYLAAGDRVAGLMDVTWKLGIALLVLVVVAWAIGVLPGAVRLF